MLDITEYCMECRNFFAPATKKENHSFIHTGEFTISGHGITPLDFIAAGQYFRIVGSAINDGVYCNTVDGLADLTDETFTGAIWEMSVPRAFIAKCAEIAAWRMKNEAADSSNMSPFMSESFAGYSYSKGGGGSSGGGNAISWRQQYAKDLNAWRRLNII